MDKRTAFYAQGKKIRIQKEQVFIRSYRIDGDYVDIFFYTPCHGSTPFDSLLPPERDETDRYNFFFL